MTVIHFMTWNRALSTLPLATLPPGNWFNASRSFQITDSSRAHAVNAKLCSQLLADKLEVIDRLVHALEGLQQEYSSRHTPHPDHQRMTKQWHFTVSQQHQLCRLLQRWMTLAPGQPAWSSTLNNMQTAAAVLQHLEQQLDV